MKGDQIIHIFICEALAVLFASLTGGMEAVWAQTRQGFRVRLKAACWGGAGPAVAGQSSRLPPRLRAAGPLPSATHGVFT